MKIISRNNFEVFRPFSVLILLLGVNLSTPVARAGDITLAWDPSPGADVVGYKLYSGFSSTIYTTSLTVGNVTNYLVSGLLPGSNYYFVVTAQNAQGEESAPSNELNYQVPVNAAPTFVPGPDLMVAVSAGPQTYSSWATAISPGSASEAGQNLNFVVSTDNNALFLVPPAIDPSGNLTLTPALSARGVAAVTVQLHDDGGTAGGGQDTSVAQHFLITVGSSVDGDGDSLPDDYELAYGLDPNSNADANGDLDGDGSSNLQEYYFGTDPTDADSALAPRLVASGPETVIRFASQPDRVYRIERNDNFPSGAWNLVVDGLPGDGTEKQVSDSNARNSTKVVYRIMTAPYTAASTCTLLTGFHQRGLLGNSDNIVSFPFQRSAVARGSIAAVSGSQVTVAGNAPWQVGQFVYAGSAQRNTHYLRVETGNKEGSYFTVTANGADSLSLDLNGDNLDALAIGDRISIVPYWTLGTLFANGNGYYASPTSFNRPTEILIPNHSGIGINLSASRTYYYYGEGWKLVGDGTGDRNDDVLLPDSYVIIRQNTASGATLTTQGEVPTGKWAIPLATRTIMRQDNYVALPRPVAYSLNDSGLIASGAFRTSASPFARVDELFVFDNALSGKNKSAIAIYYHWNGAWRKVGAGSADVGSEQVFQPGSGYIIRKGLGEATIDWQNAPGF